MKKYYFLLFVFHLALASKAQIVNIPNANFKAKLLEADATGHPIAYIIVDGSPQHIEIDTNNDGEIQVSEALLVEGLNLQGSSIADLTGLGAFANLKALECTNNSLQSIDLSQLLLLEKLSCLDNQLQTLQVNHLAQLKTLSCDGNFLTTLNVANLANLTDLSCSINQLTALDLTGMTNLRFLHCEHNNLTTLNIHNLVGVACDYNQLTSINITGTGLANLYCSHNLLTTINANPSVGLDCSYNMITSISGINQPTALNCSHNPLTSFVVPNEIAGFESIDCSYTQLSSLDTSNMPFLRSLICSNSNFTTLDLSNVPTLQSLHCSNNQMTSLNVTGLINLDQLKCKQNRLTSLSLNGLLSLERLECEDNQLTTLSLENTPALHYLYCQRNQLQTLDVTQTNVFNLYCGENQIQSLDLSNQENLQIFDCNHNQLTTLDLSDSPILAAFNCSDNLLTSLNIKNGSDEASFELNFDGNPTLEYVCQDDAFIVSVQTRITNYGYTNCHVNSYCSFIPGGTFYTIQGTTKLDSDGNGCDGSDVAYPSLKLTFDDGSGTSNLIADTSGNYFYDVQGTTQTITPVIENLAYFTISPTTATVTFPDQASPFTQNFCITPNGTHNDLEVVIVPTTNVRPGFDADYKIIYKNKGTTTQSGTLHLLFNDDVMDLVSATPTNTGSSTNNLSWDFVDLRPFETKEINMVFNINSPVDVPAVNDGDSLAYSATIIGGTDETESDNAFDLIQTVVNSFDPNDKTCLEGNGVDPSYIGKDVHYVIRFENTGTAAAENIVVKDVIDTTKFDIDSLIPMDGSHPFVTKISAGGKVEFIFENINLPFDDSNNDGYVAFKIKTKPSLVLGDSFSNSASIYFDYNFPIVTDPAVTDIVALANQDFDFGSYFILTPNPAKDILTVTSKSTIAISSASIYNALGQLIFVVANPGQTIDVSRLKTGTYFVKIVSDKGTANRKFVKE